MTPRPEDHLKEIHVSHWFTVSKRLFACKGVPYSMFHNMVSPDKSSPATLKRKWFSGIVSMGDYNVEYTGHLEIEIVRVFLLIKQSLV